MTTKTAIGQIGGDRRLHRAARRLPYLSITQMPEPGGIVIALGTHYVLQCEGQC
jgi:hypothetical protein